MEVSPMLISDLDYSKPSLNKVNGAASASAEAFANGFASGNRFAFQTNFSLAISGTGVIGFKFISPFRP
jgi:hypothetical protein